MKPSHIPLRAATVATLAISFGAGCNRPPQVTGENRRIIVSLVTAVSARNSDWLKKNAELIEKERAAGKLSDAEYQSFSAIVSQAQAGDWKSAETAAYALREAQEPTAEDLRNLEARKLNPRHFVAKTRVRSKQRR
ncbi:MAG: hypothetical protein ABSE84_07415 [Isosphaeraceae bacterium]|jgi:hypothetical protein